MSKIINYKNGEYYISKKVFQNDDDYSYLYELISDSNVPIEDITFCNCYMKVLPKLSTLKELIKISLRDCIITNENILDNLKCSKKLSILYIGPCSEYIVLPKFLEDMKCLSTIDIFETSIHEIYCDINKMNKLKFLSLEGNKHNTVFPDPVISSNSLETLRLMRCNANHPKFNVSECTKLSIVNLSDNEIVNIQNDIFSLPSLRILSVEGNRIEKLPEPSMPILSDDVIDFEVGGNPIEHIPKNLLLSDKIYVNIFYVCQQDIYPLLKDIEKDIKKDISLGVNTKDNKRALKQYFE